MEAVTVSFTESAAKSFLGKLGSILAQEAELLAGVADDARYIMDEMESMTSLLRVLSSRQDHDEQVKTWMKQVREMAYDAEDSIDVFRYRLRRRRQENRFIIDFLTYTVHLLRRLKARHDVATDLQKLKLRACHVSERRARYFLESGGATSAPNSSAPPYSVPLGEEGGLVGIKPQRDDLIERITKEGQDRFGVIAIVGFGGLGKTTLAMQVFESLKVTGSHFHAYAWIAVSQSYKMEVLLRSIIRQLSISVQKIQHVLQLSASNQNIEVVEQLLDGMREDDLRRTIIGYLQDKRYLIVLDDTWEISAWDSFKAALPYNRNGSRIIVTTRNKPVAHACCSHNSFCNYIHEVQPLSTRQSMKLFCNRVFGGSACPGNLIKLTEDILRKCDGLPLAIVTIAGALAAKPKKTPDEWRKLHDHLGIELETNDSLKNINRVLLLSYNDLPYHLKPCFLYLSIFPEDYEIHRKRLVRRWIAEGLVNGRRGMSDEEVAEGYFNELIDRSLIQPSKIDAVGKVKSCRVHDIMLEVIVSMSAEENFVTVLSEHSTTIPHSKVRRLAQQGESSVKDDLYLSQIRSLTTFGNVIPLHDYGKMRLLRVLDLQECRSLRHVHLKNIGKLFLLNFLSLRNSRYIKKLPGSIGDLSNLQFLDVRETDIQKLPRAVVKLRRLAYLRGSWFYGGLRLPREIRKMKGLQSLGVITGTDAAVLQEIGELTQLKKLSIEFKSRYKRGSRFHGCRSVVDNYDLPKLRRELCTSLQKINSSLRSLTLTDRSDRVIRSLNDLDPAPLLLGKLHLNGPILTLPAWFPKLDQIAKINLRNTYLDPDAIQVLKDLPGLVQLKLGPRSFQFWREEESEQQPETLHFGREGFAALRTLQTDSLNVSFEDGALPNLELLRLIDLRGRFREESISTMQYLSKLKEVQAAIDDEGLMDMIREIAAAHPNHPKLVVSH
ncbi:unnamed protein product [Musa textilis]